MASKTPKGGRNLAQGVSPAKGQRNFQQEANGSEYVVLDRDLVRGVSEKEVEIEHLRTTIVALQEKIQVIEDMKKDVQAHKDLLADSEHHREELQIHIKETSVTIQEDTLKHSTYQQELLEEIENLKNQLQHQKQHQGRREQEHLQVLEQLKREHSDQLQQLNDEHHTKVAQLTQDFQAKLEREQKENKQKYDQLLQEKEQQRREKDEKIRQLEIEKEEQREQYEAQINKLDAQIKQLKEIITQKSDVESQLFKARDEISRLDSQKLQLQKELETASDYILDLEDKVYKANKTSLELLRQLKDAEVELETLKNYIIELKQRIAVYIPVKDDLIDKKLAEFINNYPERQKLKIMFMRESEGVYQFGTKRVAVRVDKDKINIRVGGGYLSIDEFLDQYTPAELEKLERKDPLKKFSEKIAVQKTIVGKEVREGSPIRSPSKGTQSPTRKNI